MITALSFCEPEAEIPPKVLLRELWKKQLFNA
jgi:hypothetical protein